MKPGRLLVCLPCQMRISLVFLLLLLLNIQGQAQAQDTPSANPAVNDVLQDMAKPQAPAAGEDTSSNPPIQATPELEEQEVDSEPVSINEPRRGYRGGDILDDRIDRLTICLARGLKKISVWGESVHWFKAENEELLGQRDGEEEITLTLSESGIAVDGQDSGSKGIRLRSGLGWLEYKGKVFREELLVYRVDNRLLLVNDVHLERYLYGLINKETVPSWHQETKKSQAVAARTYAIYRKIYRPKSQYCDMGDTAVDQVYGGFSSEDGRARKAVRDTEGQVLVYNNQIVKAYFHASSGGYLASGKDVWGEAQDYLPGGPCPYCTKSPRQDWSYSISMDDLGKAFGVPSQYRSRIMLSIISRTQDRRVRRIRVSYGKQKKTYSGEKFRSKLGYSNLYSTLFSFSRKGSRFIFKGHGSGHGVGMDQWGAQEMARQGYTYDRIVNYFYPGAQLKKLY